MKSEKLTLILNWLKAHRAHLEGGLIEIPVQFREDVIEIVGDNESFKEDLDYNRVHKNFLYQRIMLNKEFAYQLEEHFWWEQFQMVQQRKIYFNNVKNRDMDPNESGDLQIRDKVEAFRKLEYLEHLSFHLDEKMKESHLWMNQLTYLIG